MLPPLRICLYLAEHSVPHVRRLLVSHRNRGHRVVGTDVPSHHEPVESADTSLPLLEIDRVRGEVPMHDVATVEVEVDALLPDRRPGPNEGPEGPIKPLTYRCLARGGALRCLLGRPPLTNRHREVHGGGGPPLLDSSAPPSRHVDVRSAGANGENTANMLDTLLNVATLEDASEQIGEFIDHRLK